MQISEGEGWRLQLDPERRPFAALIGGLNWAFELDRHEIATLRRGVIALLGQRSQLQGVLMPEEELDLELDLSLPSQRENSVEGSLFIAVNGTAGVWSLRFVLTPGDGSRAAEGAWSAAASPAVAAALEGLGEGFSEAI